MKASNPFRKFSLGVVWLWLGLFALIPNLALFLVTFLDRTETDYFIPVFTLQNYARLFDPVFISIFTNSLILASLSTLMCLAVGYPFAYFMARSGRKVRPWLLLLVVVPFWTNSLIRTYALMALLKSQGVINKLLNFLGVVEGNFSLMYTNFAVFLGLTYTLLPFMILPLYASIEKMDVRLLDAAKDLGAGPIRSFWHITLPLTLPGIVAGGILVFLPALVMFYVPEFLSGSKVMLLGTYIKNQFLVYRDWPMGATASSLLTILLIILALIYKLVSSSTAAPSFTDTIAPRPRQRVGKKRAERGAA